jgi:peptidoglycan/LPS O-acetylase OafA/YrhL
MLMESRKGHIAQLDGIRAIAALIVLADHLWRYPEGYVTANYIASSGWLGVDLFFVLSGYLITSILVKDRESPTFFRDFYLRRALRIFPAYYLMLVLLFVVFPHFSHTPALIAERTKAIWHVLYLSNVIIGIDGWNLGLISIAWSLAVEEQFYLVWPVLVRLCTRQRIAIVCGGLVVMAPLARWALYGQIGWIWDFVAMPLRADSFAWGAVIATVGVGRLARFARPAALVSGAFIAAMVLTGHLERNTLLVSSIGYSAAGMLGAAVLVLAMTGEHRILSSRPLREIGKVSYGLYLLHPLCSVIVSHIWEPKTFLGSCGFVLIAGAVSLGAATISFRFYESPFLRLKDRWTVGVIAVPTPVAASL